MPYGLSSPAPVSPYSDTRSGQRNLKWFEVVRGIGVASYAVLVAVALVTFDPELLLAVVQLPVLFLVTRAIAARLARRYEDGSIEPLLLAAFWVKMAGTLARIVINDTFYGGLSDAIEYNKWGNILASHYRTLDFTYPVGKVENTGFMRVVAGVVYSFWGNSQVGASLFFSWLALMGLVLFWLAFRDAVPTGKVRMYGYLLFFLPSMVYWPATLGKDSFSVLLLGITSYGVSRVFVGQPVRAVIYVAIGLTSELYLRPHVSLALVCGALVALAFGGSHKKKKGNTGVIRLILFGGLALTLMVVLGRTEAFFGVSQLNADSVTQTLNSTSERTSEAGSSFSPIHMDNPVLIAPAAATVLFRPFPFETSSPVSLGSSFEGLFLMWLTWKSLARIRNVPRSCRRYGYPAFALGVFCALLFAFSSFSNFGILARQRSQLFPFAFVLLCVPTKSDMLESESSISDDSVDSDGRADHAPPIAPVLVASSGGFPPDRDRYQWTDDSFRRFNVEVPPRRVAAREAPIPDRSDRSAASGDGGSRSDRNPQPTSVGPIALTLKPGEAIFGVRLRDSDGVNLGADLEVRCSLRPGADDDVVTIGATPSPSDRTVHLFELPETLLDVLGERGRLQGTLSAWSPGGEGNDGPDAATEIVLLLETGTRTPESA